MTQKVKINVKKVTNKQRDIQNMIAVFECDLKASESARNKTVITHMNRNVCMCVFKFLCGECQASYPIGIHFLAVLFDADRV